MVVLGLWVLYSWLFGVVEYVELYYCVVGYNIGVIIQGVNFLYNLIFSYFVYSWIVGYLCDGIYIYSGEYYFGVQVSCGYGGFVF